MIKRNIKMIVAPEESQQVQEICFANDIVWCSGDRSVMFTHEPFLYISMGITFGDKMESFKENSNEEVDAKFFIRTKGSCIEENQEQELKQNIKEEQMKDNEVETYKDVKEYLVAKGLYDRVMEIEWDDEVEEYEYFSDLYLWANTEEGVFYWDEIDEGLRDLGINMNIESLVQDYIVKQGKEFIQYLETQPEEAAEETPEHPTEAKPKQYLCYVSGKALPKHIHKTLEQATQEAQRLCRKELTEVMVLEVVCKYQAKVIVEEV